VFFYYEKEWKERGEERKLVLERSVIYEIEALPQRISNPAYASIPSIKKYIKISKNVNEC